MHNLYKFGPPGDIFFVTTPTLVGRLGSYESWTIERKLIAQLISHAILQLREWPRENNFCESSMNSFWEIRRTDHNNTYVYELRNGKPYKTRKTVNLLYEIYDLMYEGKLVFSIRENPDGYTILEADFEQLDECIENVLDCALNETDVNYA